MRILTLEQEAKFWAKVEKTDTCWYWTGWCNKKGYGYTNYKDATERLAHRVAYALCCGPIAEKLTIDHLCSNTTCVRPSHLEEVTRIVNYRRGNNPGKRSHCPKGHLYSPGNTYRYPARPGSPKGRRECRICSAEYKRAYKQRRRDVVSK